jgi:hypothetical protein
MYWVSEVLTKRKGTKDLETIMTLIEHGLEGAVV